MSFKSGVTTRVDNAKAILDALRSLTKKDVLVGIPSEDSGRDDVPFGNAGIGYLNEYGSPEQNIPPTTLTWSPALNRQKSRRCHSSKPRRRLLLMVMLREQNAHSTVPERWPLMASGVT